MHRFNEDAVGLVLDHYHGFSRARDFGRFARVSSLWTRPTQQRLFANPCLYTFKACDMLARTLETNRDLRHLVRSLDLRPTSSDGRTSPVSDAWLMMGVMRLLATTRLEHLTLAGDLSVLSERFLRFVDYPQSLQQLRIGGTLGQSWLETPRASLEWSSDLAMRFSSLKSLTISGPLCLDVAGDILIDEALDAESTRGCHLEELHLFDVELAEMSDAIRFLLPFASSWRNLRSFSVTVKQLSDIQLFNLETFFPLVTSTLETLVVRSRCESFSTIIHLHELLHATNNSLPLPNLRSLECANVSVFLEDLSGVVPNLEELDIDDMAYRLQRLDSFFAVIAEQRFSHLSRLVLRGDRCSSESIAHNPEAIATLTKLCDQKNIMFQCLS